MAGGLAQTLPHRRPEASASAAQRQLAEAGGADAASECIASLLAMPSRKEEKPVRA